MNREGRGEPRVCGSPSPPRFKELGARLRLRPCGVRPASLPTPRPRPAPSSPRWAAPAKSTPAPPPPSRKLRDPARTDSRDSTRRRARASFGCWPVQVLRATRVPSRSRSRDAPASWLRSPIQMSRLSGRQVCGEGIGQMEGVGQRGGSQGGREDSPPFHLAMQCQAGGSAAPTKVNKKVLAAGSLWPTSIFWGSMPRRASLESAAK